MLERKLLLFFLLKFKCIDYWFILLVILYGCMDHFRYFIFKCMKRRDAIVFLQVLLKSLSNQNFSSRSIDLANLVLM